MSINPSIGYLGMDLRDDATYRDEVARLRRAGVALDAVSVRAVAWGDQGDGDTDDRGTLRVRVLPPTRPCAAASDLARAAVAFWRDFGATLWGAMASPAEGFGARFQILTALFPALAVALYWKDRNIGHIHANGAGMAATIAMHAARLLGIGFSFTGDADDLFARRAGLDGKIRRMRFLVCLSEAHRNFYRGRGADRDRLPVAYRGIDLDRFQPGETGAVPERVPRIVGVGRLAETNGFHDLIAACALLRERGSDYECVIAGEGPEEGRLRQLIADHGLGGLIQLTGRDVRQEDCRALLHTARVCALPCVRDRDGECYGLPDVLLAAMASGVPVVSTRLAGIPDLVRDGENGALVAPGDIPALAGALHRLLHEPGRAESASAHAARWVRTHFGREDMVARLAQLLTWAAETPGDGPPPFRFDATPGSEVANGASAPRASSIGIAAFATLRPPPSLRGIPGGRTKP